MGNHKSVCWRLIWLSRLALTWRRDWFIWWFDIRYSNPFAAHCEKNYISSTAWLKETSKMTRFGVWTKLKSDGLLLTVLTETDGSLSVNHGYNCFVRKTNQQKVFMCVLFIIFCFSYASKHWHPPSRNGSCLCNLFQTTVKNRFRKNIIFNYWDWVCHYFG